jgi:hypothetical protein
MLKTALTILLIVVVFGAVYCLVLIVSPQTVSGHSLKANEELQNPAFANALYDVVRHMGALGLAANIAAFFILINGFKKGEKWAWWGFFCTGIVGWVYGVTRFIINGDTKNLVGNLIGFVLFLIGVLLPLKVFFPKKAVAGPTSPA